MIYEDLFPIISPQHFHQVAAILRSIFVKLGYLEVHPQNRLSILAACEDPHTIATYTYAGEIWPLPQTNQMWLEHDLLKNPDLPGVFCLTTSYRNEPNPKPGRHHLSFPMFEFEGRGDFEDLKKIIFKILVEFIGLSVIIDTRELTYELACKNLESKEIGHKEESMFSLAALIYDFPEKTHPFWNMKRERTQNSMVAKKIDVILGGMETIGSAERSCDPEQMLNSFNTVEDGRYKAKLFELFGEDRVMKELNTFLELPFIRRFGGGIGITRLIHGLAKNDLLKTPVYR